MNPIFLIVEDEPITSRFIREIIEDIGYQVAGSAKSALEARKFLAQQPVDIIIMDINIQGSEDGIQLSRSLADENVAIVYISAYSDPQTLQEAAVTVPYGFLVKPFREADLMAVLHIVVSRIKKEHLDGKKQTQEKFSECWLDVEHNRLYWYTQIIELSKNETAALNLFWTKPDSPITMEELRQAVWGDKSIGDSTIRELINRIRNKVDDLCIENIYGTGYILKR
jgi:DNA-binding response OmpR family regulator